MYLAIMTLLSEKNSFDGLFSGSGKVVGIVLMVTGFLLIYIAVKVAKGYSFMPTLGQETIIREDTYVEGTAKVIEKQVSKMPDLGGGEEKDYVEWKIAYTVDGEEYTQMIPDDGQKEDEEISIKYDPKNPSAFYLADDDEKEPDEYETDPADTSKSRNIGIILGILGILVIVGGAALAFM